MSLLRQCGTTRLLRKCGTATLLRACSPPPPRDICTEFNNAPDPYSFYLKFTWSGTLTRCTDCWNVDRFNHWQCDEAPTSLPNVASSNSCLGPTVALPSWIHLEDYYDYCGGFSTSGAFDFYATFYWKCTDGLFQLLVASRDNDIPMFYAAGYNIKDGDVLANQLGCLSFVSEPCSGSSLTFPAFTTGGSFKVEIV